MRITATQKIAHYSVNFDLIHKSFALLVFINCIVSYLEKFQGHSISGCAGRRG